MRKFPPLLSLLIAPSSLLYAQDTVCDSISGGGVNVDIRSFPTTPGFTVINGRTDGSPDACIIGASSNSVIYPNGLTINSNGTGLIFAVPNVDIDNSLTIDDAGMGSGFVTFRSDFSTNISGDVNIINNAQLKLITHNTGSSTTRLHTQNANFNVAMGSNLDVEFNLDSTTGQFLRAQSISGEGDINLTNTGSSANYGTLIIEGNGSTPSTYSGTITYDNQEFPALSKNGSGTFIFDGNVQKLSGGTPGFTDGFGFIEVNEGILQTTSNAFVYGTRVQLNGGELVLDQDFDANVNGARFEGTGALTKRGSGIVTLGNVTRFYRGKLTIEEGTLGLSGSSTLGDADSVTINPGAILDVSNIGNSTSISRLYGGGDIILGGKRIAQVISINPGTSASAIGTLSFIGPGTLDLSGTLINIDMDPTAAAGDVAGVTHDQIATGVNITRGTNPLIKLIDKQAAGTPSAFLGGREFTIFRAASGLSQIPASAIVEDTHSFHAFVGANPETTTISDTEIKVQFGIKTAQQVVTTVAQTPTPTQLTPSGPTAPSKPGSSSNKGQAAQQYIQQTLGISGNQQPTIAQLNNHPALQNLTTAGLTFASSQNNPEAYSSNLTVGLESTELISSMALEQASRRYLSQQEFQSSKLGVEPLAPRNRLWLDTVYTDGSVDGASNVTGNFGYDIFGIAIGSDLIQNHKHTTGVYLGAAFSSLKEHDHISQDIDNNYFLLGLYDQYRLHNGFQLNSVINAFYGTSDSSRQNFTTTGTLAPTSNADFDSYGFTLGTRLSKAFQLEHNFDLTPSAGLLYTYLQQESFTESGGGSAYDYSVDSSDAQALLLMAGMDLNHSHTISTGKLITKLRLQYEYDVYADNNSSHDIAAGLGSIPRSTFVGQNRGPHGLLAGIGVEAAINAQCQIGAGYLYSWRSHGHESSVGGNFTYFW